MTGRLADLPPDEQRARDDEARRELAEGLARRDETDAYRQQAYSAAQHALILRSLPVLRAATRLLRGG